MALSNLRLGIIRLLAEEPGIGFEGICRGSGLGQTEATLVVGRMVQKQMLLATQSGFMIHPAFEEFLRLFGIDPFRLGNGSSRRDAIFLEKPNVAARDDMCFVLMPFSDGMRPIYDDHIVAAVRACNLVAKRADDFMAPGVIMEDVWNSIRSARLLIADLTGRNPNVFYETGMAHALGKDVILLTQSLNDVPFDLKHIRCLAYEFTPRGCKKLEGELRAAIEQVLSPHEERNARARYGARFRHELERLRAFGSTEGFSWEGDEAVENIARMGVEAVPWLVEVLGQEPDANVRYGSVQSLGRSRAPLPEVALKALMDAARGDAAAAVRAKATEVLAQSNFYESRVAGDVTDVLLHLLNDDDSDVRYWAANGLGSSRSEGAVDGLLRALKTERAPMVRDQIVFAGLGELKSKSAIPALSTIAVDTREAPDLRHSALVALRNIGDPSAIPALIQGLTDASGEIRQTCVQCLFALVSDRPALAVEPQYGVGQYTAETLANDVRSWQQWWRRTKAFQHGDPPRKRQVAAPKEPRRRKRRSASK